MRLIYVSIVYLFYSMSVLALGKYLKSSGSNCAIVKANDYMGDYPQQSSVLLNDRVCYLINYLAVYKYWI